jgi:hypothetical protein
MIDHLLRTAGHWSDPAVRQTIIKHTAHVLAARGAETWLPAFERLRNRLHLSRGILEHQTITESIDRDRNPSGYAQARIGEIKDEARAKASRRTHTSRRQPTEPALPTAAMPIRPEHTMPPDRAQPAGPAR